MPPAPDEINQSSEMAAAALEDANEDAGEGIVPISSQGGRTDWQGQLPPGIASAD